jgi:hypothetical protein
VAVIDAEYFSASAVEAAVVFCILDFHEMGDLLYSISMLDMLDVDSTSPVTPFLVCRAKQHMQFLLTPSIKFDT